MKKISKISACALLAAGVVTSAYSQVQVAGTLWVNLDATALPVGPISYITNSAAANSIFASYTNLPAVGQPKSAGPQVIALGGSGTHGILFDGNCLLQQTDASALPGAGAPVNAPATITGAINGSFIGFSAEAWVYAATLPADNPVVSWGTRGNCSPNQISCAYGSSSAYGGLAMWCHDEGWGGGGSPAAGQWHLLAWTVDVNSNEVLYADGVVKATYTGVVPDPDPNNNILIGASHANAGDSLSGAVYGGEIVGRVRVEDGILSSLQVSNNYAYEVQTFTNGVPVFLSAKPLHRWSFTNAAANATGATVTDVGTANGSTNQINAIVRNNGGTANFTGSALTLSGGSSATAPYVDFTNSLISVLSTNNGGSGLATLEAWATESANTSWTPLFDIGDTTVGKVTGPGGSFNGVNYLGFVANPNGGDANHSAIGTVNGNFVFDSQFNGHPMYVAVTWDDVTNNVITVYENGVQVAQTIVTNRMAGIQDLNNWLGRSVWSGDVNFGGSVQEFREFNRIVTPAEILNDYQVGPTVVSSVEKWNGNISGNWDINTTANWLVGATSVKYNDGGTVQFDDTLTGTPKVNVTTTVQPGTLTVNNTHSNYVFSGSGNISGAVGLTKNGSGTLTINNLNNYTGITTVNAGTLIVTNLANGGSASAIGAASASPVNLALSGGTLSYQGPPTSINRGYTAGAGTLDAESNLAISGQVTGGGGNFTKEGPATLTYNGAQVNQLSSGDFYADNGTVVLDGTAGETNNISGQIYVGSDLAHSATLILTNTTANLGSWFAIARGNGTGGYTSTASLYNSTMNCANFSLGYANGVVGNNQTGILNLNGNSHLINGASFNLGESAGSTCSVTVSNNSWIYSGNRILIGLSTGSTGSVLVANSGAITNLNWTSIGAPGVGTATLQDNAVWQSLTDFNVTDTAGTSANPSLGTLNILNNSTLIINTLYMGKSAYCTGTINQSGGTILRNGGGDWRIGGNNDNSAGANPNQVAYWNLSGGTITCAANFQMGAYGTGYFNQTGGTVNLTGGYPSIGRFLGGTGTLNVSGGSFNQLTSGTILIIGEEGTGTLNVSGTGAVNAMNRLGVGWHDSVSGTGTVNLTNGVISATNNVTIGGGGTGTVNLYGGTLATRQIIETGGTGSLNFYGGKLQAMPGANANFLSGLAQATAYGPNSGYVGATIDSGANSITIGQDLYDGDGSGNLTKIGAGTLTLSGNLYYAGATTVSQGELIIPTGINLSGTLVADDGATLDIQVAAANNQAVPANVTLGVNTGSTLQFDLGAFGVPGAAPLVTSGTLQKNGTTVISVTGSGLTTGDVPLLQYGALAGSGNFVVGSLPPGVVGYIFTNTANPSIDLFVTAVNILLWTGGVNTNWDFNVLTDYNWTNILNSTPALYTQGSSVVFDDSASTATVTLTTANSPSSITFSNSVLNYTLQGKGKITGTTGLALDGTAAVALNITNSTYSGTTLLTGGSLTAGYPSALSPNSSIVVSNATLELNANSQSVSNLTALDALVDGTTATLTGTGFSLENTTVNVALAGSGSLTALGTSAELVTVANNNSYTGKTVVSGGTLNVTNLQNGLTASSIGMSSASPTNLVLAGGTLSYQGVGASINRGYSVAGSSTLDTEGNLALGGQITASAGNFTKSGPANLTLNGAGNNVLSVGGGGAAVGVANGTLIIGGNAAQTNNVVGETWVGFNQLNNASLILTNTTLTNSSWFAVGRGNGTGGFTSTADLYNSAYTAGNVSFGFDGGVAGNSQTVAVTLHGNSQLLDNGGTGFNLSESPGSSSSLVISNTSSVYSLNRFLVAMSPGYTGAVLIADSGLITVNNGWTDIADSGVGTATLENNAVWRSLTDFNVTDLPGTSASPSLGTVNIMGNAQLIIDTLYVGKAYGNPANGYCTGIVNQSGGTVVGTNGGDWRIGGNNTTNAGAVDSTLFGTYNLSGGVVSSPGNLQLGAGGSGEWNQTGGTTYSAAYPSVGRWPNSYGQADISGGTFNQTNIATFMLVGESGTGVLNITNTGWVSAVGGLDVGANATGVGTVNLGGGTLSVAHVFTGSGSGTFNFNGGLLQALPSSYLNFMSGLAAANVLAGGVVIDSGANTIAIGQPLLDGGTGGGLTKFGSGKLELSGVNTYTGNTTISNGTLAVNGVVAGAVNVVNGTLGGVGEIAGPVTVNPTGTLAPGDAIGTLTNYNTMTLHGTAVMRISRSSGVLTSDRVVGLTQVNYGGALVVNDVGTDQLHVGDTFQLFSAGTYAGSFASVSLPAPYIWATNLNVGAIQVTGIGVATNPTNIMAAVVGGKLQISWPADHTGWSLQAQTNTLAAGLGTNWVTVSGSTTTNQVTVPISSANGSVFYRITY